jgi:disulfide bond formation protein DsbB
MQPLQGGSVPGTHSYLHWLVFGMAAATLAGAYIFEYGFDLAPCPLCLAQRLPYWAGMVAMLAGAFLPQRFRFWAFGMGTAIFAIGFGLGLYHAGIEWHFWPGPEACSGTDTELPFTVEGLARALDSAAPVPRCDEAPWRFLGLSLAGYNALLSLALAVLCALGARAWRLTLTNEHRERTGTHGVRKNE